ncbi:transmembrane protein 26-like isoform X1 [Betta splendens]|uniref:Transmembrane protein 26-like isoform X1 n=1 Tax=Betta splendens TaxID=158456 RepID=A0A6P7KJV0_BETSP|nr:transmembrane protein 26-like isoform X1 [Betta splendens]
MGLIKFVCAVFTRALFVLVSLAGVLRVTWVKKDPRYWSLAVLCVPLVVEMIITLKRRMGQDYKWFSPPIFLFLISIIPSIWFLELHYQENRTLDPQCKKLDSWESVHRLISVNATGANQTYQNYLKQHIDGVLSAVCSNDWILALHQILLILLILGKWLLPLGGGVTRDELSQLLLIFVGTAADILEFTSETLSDVKWRKQPSAGLHHPGCVDVEHVAVSSTSVRREHKVGARGRRPGDEPPGQTQHGHLERHGGPVHPGRALPGGPAHRHDLLQRLPPDAGLLRHQELPGGGPEPVQAGGDMPGLQTPRRRQEAERRAVMRVSESRGRRLGCRRAALEGRRSTEEKRMHRLQNSLVVNDRCCLEQKAVTHHIFVLEIFFCS